jgi:hypothetical protein
MFFQRERISLAKYQMRRCLEASQNLILSYNRIPKSICQILLPIKKYVQTVRSFLITLLQSISLRLIPLILFMKNKRFRSDKNKLLLI